MKKFLGCTLLSLPFIVLFLMSVNSFGFWEGLLGSIVSVFCTLTVFLCVYTGCYLITREDYELNETKKHVLTEKEAEEILLKCIEFLQNKNKVTRDLILDLFTCDLKFNDGIIQSKIEELVKNEKK